MSRTDWEVVIGLEVHAQLNTASKIFSGASTAFGAAPNVQASAVDIALPGVLPVLNRGAVERAIRFGLAIGAHVAPTSVFARKNYFYPDLPKGYQISQMDLPVVVGGEITIRVGEGEAAYEKTVRLTRAHLEEDAGKSLHEDFHGMTGIDLNRAGTPLLEIVSEPDMRSSAEAVAYARALHALVRWIDICDGNMQEGSFRCDANVSVRKKGAAAFGTRREIKNLNSFRFLQQAIDYEVQWQIDTLEDGGTIQQATVLFDPDSGETRMMRSKEDAHDYRYFPDPDLLPLAISDEWKARVKEEMFDQIGLLPEDWRKKFVDQYGLSRQDAIALTPFPRAPIVFEDAALAAAREGESVTDVAKVAANWVINEYLPRWNASAERHPDIAIPEGVHGSIVGYLIRLVRENVINNKTAKDLFDEFWQRAEAKFFDSHGGTEHDVDRLIEERGLKQVTDSGAIEAIIDEVLAANPKSVEEFRAGKEKAFNALVGQAMKASKGKANPAQVNELLRKKLTG
ncbi:Asp-tRNA(Asn)/Glu-tRNA(Gln) amidotransferase subunit GatB [Thauera sp. UPWRP]|nr:Asp-tRNA(Asn)/Glu-tRNA(Gln) amidotransferase subunit GatB [Thauera sp.]TMW76428.1 Asp-tRNA(Asn)/Glu-tRNA(Gln) amidotransferase subunit GatB [Thauera sp. UPWRP]